MLKNKLIDGIISEPLGGAHTNPEEAFKLVKAEILKQLSVLQKIAPAQMVKERVDKFCSMGVVKAPN
jgi:acetyl-CoA carboxylase carboxyl transferase subunit alpha